MNLLRFEYVSFAGEQPNLEVRTFQGSRSTGPRFLEAFIESFNGQSVRTPAGS